MQIYIDESGDLGKSGRYFVIAALVFTESKGIKRIKNLVRNCCVRFGKSQGQTLDELKGFDLSFSNRQNFLSRLTSVSDFRISYIVADKNYLHPKLLTDKNICYNYLASYLLAPILQNVKEDVHIVLDNHTTKVASINSLKDYIKIQAYTDWGFSDNLIINYGDSRNYKNLQAIDVVANTILGYYHLKKHHMFDLLKNTLQYQVKFPSGKFGL